MRKMIGMSIAVLGLCVLSEVSLDAATIVAPNGLENTDGSGNNVRPFSAGLFGEPADERSQQVYAANQFGPSGSIFEITSIAFRLDGQDAAGFESRSYANVRVDLSTTSKTPNGLSGTFADNVGTNDEMVYNNSLTLSGAGGASPNPFDLIITLDTPFVYSSAMGNLLVDIRITGPEGGFIATLDAVNSPATSRIVGLGDANAITGYADSVGLVTQFSGVQVAPEPSTDGYLVLAFGTAGAGLLRFRRKGQRRS